jgi:hypothetical protein
MATPLPGKKKLLPLVMDRSHQPRERPGAFAADFIAFVFIDYLG